MAIINPGRRKPKLGKPIKTSLDQKTLAEGYKQGSKTFDTPLFSHLQSRDFSGTSAPRVGGTSKSDPNAAKVSGTSSKKVIKQSIRNIKKSAASPQAKRSALASYKKK